MARIRTVKPEFFTSESVCSVDPLARLLFIGLWCEADREGRLKWRPATLKIRYLPVDNCDITTLVQQLIDQDMIVVYECDGVKYCEIPAFKSHQVINNREKDSELPSRVEGASVRVKAEGRKERKEGKGKEYASSKSKRFAPPTVDQVKQYCFERKNNVDPNRFIDYYTANGWQVGKSKMKDWKAAVRNWEGNNNSQQAIQPAKQYQSLTEAARL